MNQNILTSLDRKIAPSIRDAVDFHLELKACHKAQLDNGVPVYSVHAGAEEVLQLELVFSAGNWYEEHNLDASATNYLLKNGTRGHSAFDINEHFEFYGAYLNRNCYNETANITLHCLSRHLNALLPMVREILTESTLPESELDIYRQNMKQKLEVNLKKCDVVANRLIDEYLYGADHPYGRNSHFKDYDALDLGRLLRFYDQYYRNGQCMIFVGGYLPDDLLSQLNAALGDLPLNRTALRSVEHLKEPAIEKIHRVENDPNSVQGAIRLARPFPSRRHPDFQKVQVLNALFGGYFGSRLMSNIREEKGYTYGIYSFLQNHMGEGAWVISTEAGKSVCEDTIKEVRQEMKKLREGPIPDEELKLVKNYLMGIILGDIDGPFHIIGRWKNIILHGLDENYFSQSIETIRTIEAAELTRLANQYLTDDSFYELIVY